MTTPANKTCDETARPRGLTREGREEGSSYPASWATGTGRERDNGGPSCVFSVRLELRLAGCKTLLSSFPVSWQTLTVDSVSFPVSKATLNRQYRHTHKHTYTHYPYTLMSWADSENHPHSKIQFGLQDVLDEFPRPKKDFGRAGWVDPRNPPLSGSYTHHNRNRIMSYFWTAGHPSDADPNPLSPLAIPLLSLQLQGTREKPLLVL